MRTSINRHLSRVVVTAFFMAAAGVAVQAPAAHAAPCPTKCYSAVLAPAEYTAGSSVNFSIELTNLTTPGGQLVGSADITPPAGFTVTSVDQPEVGSASVEGNVIQLRSLGLRGGESGTYTWTASTPAEPGTYTWSIQAKQSNDFKGAGNDLKLDESSSSLTTTGSPAPTTCEAGAVSCATNFIDYSQPSSVSTGSSVDETVWHVGTTSFPATEKQGGQLYSMLAKEVPDNLCLGQPCAFQMNIDDIPAAYEGRPATLTLLVHASRFPSSSLLLLFKQIEDGSVHALLPCNPLLPNENCYEYTRDAESNLLVTVRNLHPGDPKIAGMSFP